MRGGKWCFFAWVWVACMGCNKATDSFEIQILHVGGKPHAGQPVVPFAADSIAAGWWSHDAFSTLGDTVWTDAYGKVTLPYPHDRWDGLICSLRTLQEQPGVYAFTLKDLTAPSATSIYCIPGAAHVRFVGNRHGHGTSNGFWLFHDWETPSPQPERWLTPGQPPAPSLLLHHWIHPNESLPTTRRHITLSPNGEVDTMPVLFIHEEMIGDTIRHPILL